MTSEGVAAAAAAAAEFLFFKRLRRFYCCAAAALPLTVSLEMPYDLNCEVTQLCLGAGQETPLMDTLRSHRSHDLTENTQRLIYFFKFKRNDQHLISSGDYNCISVYLAH